MLEHVGLPSDAPEQWPARGPPESVASVGWLEDELAWLEDEQRPPDDDLGIHDLAPSSSPKKLGNRFGLSLHFRTATRARLPAIAGPSVMNSSSFAGGTPHTFAAGRGAITGTGPKMNIRTRTFTLTLPLLAVACTGGTAVQDPGTSESGTTDNGESESGATSMPTSDSATATDASDTTSPTDTSTTNDETDSSSEATSSPDASTTSPSGSCGDTVVDDGEECDEGAASAQCDEDCTLPVCGDSLVNADAEEQCDPGDAGETAECDEDCTLASCGDGVMNASAGESCDDAAETAECNGDCTVATCGDGHVNALAGEICDDGPQTATCNGDCTPSSCGDGYINAAAGESCDVVAETAECDGDCTLTMCGDGHINALAGEVCDDDGETADCDGDCTPVSCGDGQPNYAAGEVCDDGDDDPDDGCDDCFAAFATASMVDAGNAYTCGIGIAGNVRCWGEAEYLGYANGVVIGDNETPASAGDVDVGGTVVQLAAHQSHTCAVMAGGAVRCWGSPAGGQLGYGNLDPVGDDEVPAVAGDVDVGGVAVQVVAGYEHSCALLEGGSVRCWGNGADGRLGYGNEDVIGDDESPATAGDVDVGGPVVQLTAGWAHNCALLQGGAIRCWGWNPDGQLGYGNTADVGDNELPSSAGDVDIGGDAIQVQSFATHTCALLDGGAVRCWGYGGHGRLGYGDTNSIGDNELPSTAGDVNVGVAAAHLVTGHAHTCVVSAAGAVRCWGAAAVGQLGYANVNAIGDDEVPAFAGDVDVGGEVVRLSAGTSHTCALIDTGAIRCWGVGATGRLGYGNLNNIGDNESPASAGNVTF